MESMGAQRQKYWSELTEVEKIDRMHMVIREQREEIQGLYKSVEQLLGHTHSLDGKPSIPINTRQLMQVHSYKPIGKEDIF